MKRLLLVLISMMLVFGCVQQPSPGANVTTGNITAPPGPAAPPVNQTPGPSCAPPSYTVTEPPDAKLSDTGLLVVNATCASSKQLVVYLNDEIVGQSTVPGDAAILNFNLVASRDQTNSLVVKSDGETVHSGGWDVASIGFFDTGGKETDSISINHQKAVAFDLSNSVEVRRVGAFLKRLEDITLESNIVLEIRQDSGGEPGALVSSSSVPITKATLTPNWIYFPVDARLSKGRHWLVFRVDKENDYVYIYYKTVDKLKKGNANHLMMDLVKDEDAQKWETTEWEKLSYDRNYAFMVSAIGEE